MSTYNFVSTESARPKHFDSSQCQLVIRQQPDRARLCNQKERDRRPVDPPPIIQLKVADDHEEAQNYLQSPYFFMCANLQHANDDTQVVPAMKALAGTIVSSLHRLKDIDNSDGGFFVFGDLSIKMEGKFRLRFSLFEIIKDQVIHVKSVISNIFEVFSPKNFPGMSESTFLSRSFSDQGVRIRIRKEHRIAMKRAPPKSNTENNDDNSISSVETGVKRKRTRQGSEHSGIASPNISYIQQNPANTSISSSTAVHHASPAPIYQYPMYAPHHPSDNKSQSYQSHLIYEEDHKRIRTSPTGLQVQPYQQLQQMQSHQQLQPHQLQPHQLQPHQHQPHQQPPPQLPPHQQPPHQQPPHQLPPHQQPPHQQQPHQQQPHQQQPHQQQAHQQQAHQQQPNPQYFGTRYESITPRPFPYGYPSAPGQMTSDPYYPYPPQSYVSQYHYEDPRMMAMTTGAPGTTSNQTLTSQQQQQQQQQVSQSIPQNQHGMSISNNQHPPSHSGAVPVTLAPHGYETAQSHQTYSYVGQYSSEYGRPPPLQPHPSHSLHGYAQSSSGTSHPSEGQLPPSSQSPQSRVDHVSPRTKIVSTSSGGIIEKTYPQGSRINDSPSNQHLSHPQSGSMQLPPHSIQQHPDMTMMGYGGYGNYPYRPSPYGHGHGHGPGPGPGPGPSQNFGPPPPIPIHAIPSGAPAYPIHHQQQQQSQQQQFLGSGYSHSSTIPASSTSRPDSRVPSPQNSGTNPNPSLPTSMMISGGGGGGGNDGVSLPSISSFTSKGSSSPHNSSNRVHHQNGKDRHRDD